jgi:DNA-binding transcriptional LysR family regulator
MRLKSTLEQWNTLKAIDEHGSIQAASVQMNKSHTTLIYAMNKLEEQLGVALLKVVGKRAELTKEGKTLLRYANSMLEQAENLEVMSGQLSKGTESEITVTIDHLCNKEILYLALQIFIKRNAVTSVQVIETSLTSTIESVTNQLSDIALINIPITNVPVEAIGIVSMIPVVSKNHPLATLAMKEPLTMGDFTNETQIVLRDLGSADKEQMQDDMNVGWLKAKRRITVDTFDVALQAVKNGLGFTRIPLYMYDKLENNDLVKLQVAGANCYQIPVHITLPKGVDSGPATLELYDLIIETASAQASNSHY